MAGNTGRIEVWVEVDNTPPELWVNELTDNPTLEYPEYRINGTVDPGVMLVINGSDVSHDGTFEYTTNVTEGVNTILVNATDAAGNAVNWTKTRLVDTDDLPDYYETEVTGTDPLDGDSDSSLTPENEADNGINDDMETFQSGILPSLINMRIGTDPFKEDTDDDGLTDEFELLKLGLLTDPLSGQTNGIQDTDADPDEDGLTNLEEQTYGTDPLVPDTDRDNLPDRDEITGGSNPLVKDTDGDGLEDDGEFRLGTYPNNRDSDGDGIPDGLDTYSNQEIIGEVATVVIDGVGDASRTTNITNASVFVALTEMAGSIGKVVDINSTSQFTSATIYIPYNEAELGSISENDLKMYFIDESDHSITFLDVQGVDSVNNVVWGQTDHFSTFGIVSYSSYMDVWNSGSNPTVPEYTYGDMINIKANVHNTGDADVNDNVLYFYAGNPDAGGSYLGSATINGGISQGSAKTATLYGYTITSSAVDIYVKVDPLDSITEKSELNNKAYKTLSIVPQNFDSDGDGLTDYDENNGMRTAFGIVKTDPNNRDTDGDGLTDGEEMGARYNDRYYLNSDPSITDSDNDGLIDPHEVKDNTCLNPFNKDSDGDTILDGNDSDPCGVFPPEEEGSLLVIARDFALGAALGDMGMPGGILEQPQESWSSPYYLLGHILSGILPIGDIRDIAENIRQGNVKGALINAVGLIPIGDLAKVSKVIKNYIKYAPVSKVDEIFVFINRVILDNMPNSLTEPLWNLFRLNTPQLAAWDKGIVTT